MPLNADPMPESLREEQPATLLRNLMVAFAVDDFEALRMKKNGPGADVGDERYRPRQQHGRLVG